MADSSRNGPLIVKKDEQWTACENNADLPGNLFDLYSALKTNWGAASNVEGGFNTTVPGYPANVTYLQSGDYRVILSYESELLEPSEVPLYAG